MTIPPFWGSLAGIVIIIAIIAALLWIIFKMGKSLLKVILGIIANSVLGVIAILVLNLFNIGIPIALFTLIPVALFGLPAVGTLLILRLFSVVL